MVSTIQNFYKSYSSLRPGEVESKLMKVFLASPALLALGSQAFGSLPLKPLIATIALADVAFYYFAQRHPELYVKARKYERWMDAVHILALTWSGGHLFQALAGRTNLFPLTAESVLRTYTTYDPHRYISINGGPWRHAPYDTHFFDWWLLSGPVVISGSCACQKTAEWPQRTSRSQNTLCTAWGGDFSVGDFCLACDFFKIPLDFCCTFCGPSLRALSINLQSTGMDRS